MDMLKAQQLIMGEISLIDLTKEELKDYYTTPSTRLVEVHETCSCCGSRVLIGYEEAGFSIGPTDEQVEEMYKNLHEPIS